MKSFKTFRLDTANHLLYRDGDRVPLAPKVFDLLAYLADNPGRLVSQDEILQALWSETYVNPEVLRKYILEIRKVLGDRAEQPEFIETLPKRGYRFIAPITDEDLIEAAEAPVPLETERAPEGPIEPQAVASEPGSALPQRRLGKLALVSILAIVVAAAIAGYFLIARRGANAASPKSVSIAVLPFTDTSAASDQEYFSDGLAEQLINDLAKSPGIKVIGRSSAFQFKGKNEDARVVGRKLGVANVLEGSIRRDGNEVRITAELIKTEDGFQIWSQTYDQEIKDIFAVQDEIAQSATEALQVKLLGSNGQPFDSTTRSTNPEAYQAYLQAEHFRARGQSKEDLGKALAYADQAIQLDQKYAPAWALRAVLQDAEAAFDFVDPAEGFRRARNDAERALELDPNSASAYLALASTQLRHDWDWDDAAISLRKAAALEPGDVEIIRTQSSLARVSGNLDLAIKLTEQAVALDPLRTNSHLYLGHLMFVAGRYDDAQRELGKALELNSQAAYIHLTLGQILLAEKKPQQALTEFEMEPSEWGKLMGQALAYHALGRPQPSDAALTKLIATHGQDAAFQVAQVYAYRGQPDKAWQWLERAYQQRDSGLPSIKTEPLLESMRHDPRYAGFLEKMHLPK